MLNKSEIKDERWAIATFRPLLKLLNVQNIPSADKATIIYLADYREWIINGLGACIVVIEQQKLPKGTQGLHIVSHKIDVDSQIGIERNFFRLQIILNSDICGKESFENRVDQKIAAVHEFTHTVATLSAISRIDSKPLIERLKRIMQEKAHVTRHEDIKLIAAELESSLLTKLEQAEPKENLCFHDEHFRLGFEDFPPSYSAIFEEFLFSKEMFEEYFEAKSRSLMCKAIAERNMLAFSELVKPVLTKISEEKALRIRFVLARFIDFWKGGQEYCIISTPQKHC